MRCIHPDPNEAIGCAYRKNLEQGRIFYGKNAFIHLVKPGQRPTDTGVVERKHTIYLSCYDRLFTILFRAKNNYSYKLSGEQFEKVEKTFKSLSIPYKTKTEQNECIIETRANSRVVMNIGGDEFHVLNFNSYLINNYHAQKICRALSEKNIKSRVEVIGGYGVIRQIEPSQRKPVEDSKPKTEESKHKIVYEQISFFDIA
jgi:hypothetical protein